MTEKKGDDRAEQMARRVAGRMLEQFKLWKTAQDTDEPVEYEGDMLSYDDLVDRIHQEPLSLQVRDGWRRPDCGGDGPEEFELLLATGGPALRVYGRLDEHCEPESARLEYQDWFTPWEPLACATREQDEAILWYASLFWYGGS